MAISISGPFSMVEEFDLLVNQSFNMRSWYVAFHKTRASCSSFCKLVCFLVATMPYMCSNPLKGGGGGGGGFSILPNDLNMLKTMILSRQFFLKT